MSDLEKAKSLLIGETTCVAVKDGAVYVSSFHGVRPIMVWIKEGKDLSGFSLADKVIGKAAASLVAYAGIKYVFGRTMSKTGLDYLADHHIEASYLTLVNAIMNQAGTDFCPMEKAVRPFEDAKDCYNAITREAENMAKGK